MNGFSVQAGKSILVHFEKKNFYLFSREYNLPSSRKIKTRVWILSWQHRLQHCLLLRCLFRSVAWSYLELLYSTDARTTDDQDTHRRPFATDKHPGYPLYISPHRTACIKANLQLTRNCRVCSITIPVHKNNDGATIVTHQFKGKKVQLLKIARVYSIRIRESYTIIVVFCKWAKKPVINSFACDWKECIFYKK